eukprot:gene833-245_t
MGGAKNGVNGVDHAEGDLRKHFKPGQTKLTPNMGDATRGFYTSLLKEKPNSLIAIKYCVEQGCLDKEEHNKLLDCYLKLKEMGYYQIKRPSEVPEISTDFKIGKASKKRKIKQESSD